MIELKGGHKTTDPRLDRLPQFDQRSRGFAIRPVLEDAGKRPRSYSWSVRAWLDQGQEGACVGFGWAHELAARPVVCKVSYELAHDKIYKEAQKIDEWPGENYEGTSVLAGAKVVKSLGYMGEYRWAFGLDDLILAVGHAGPAVLGVNWYETMFATDPDGFIHVDGDLAGGHCICCFGVNLPKKFFRLHNSWGRDWGVDGNALISFDDMAKLLASEGEACIPMGRRQVRDVVGHGG